MAEYNKPTTQEELDKNFQHLHPIMDATMAHYASARCLYCYDAPCIEACPSDIDIPLFIRQIRTGNIDGAARTIYSKNYFGQICGQVCPTAVLCEGACVYTEQDVEPVEIGALQAYACHHAIDRESSFLYAAPDNGKKVAVVGAGPAGIACACELRAHGYTVDIYDAKEHPSGLALYGTAPYKITNAEVLAEVEYLQKRFGFQIQYNQPITTTEQFADLENQYDAIFLGIGLGQTRDMQIPGEELDGCLGATEYIEIVKMDPLNAFPGERVVVIGGGNTAMDAASESARLGAKKVTLAYRRSQEAMPAYAFEYDLAKGAGVQGIFNVTPISINGATAVDSITLARTTEVDGMLQIIDGSQFDIPCDAIIKATGQTKMTELLSTIGISFEQSGRIVVDTNGQTSNPKYFAGGDAVNGGAEVVNAVAEGKVAGTGINAYLSA